MIIAYLHSDHADGLDRYPNARVLCAGERAYAVGPCMCHPALQMPYTPDHIYSGRDEFVDGSMQIAPGVQVHCIGGRARGLRVIEIETADGLLCLVTGNNRW